MKIKNPKLLFFSILLSQLAGIIGSTATMSAIPTWYVTLNKPSFNPPNWIFGPVWITLYTMMGIALYLVWVKKQTKETKITKNLFLAHLLVNALWSLVFFGLKRLDLAFIVIIALWWIIIYLIEMFKKIDKKASYLLVPYLLWVTFASVLNYAIWQLN